MTDIGWPVRPVKERQTRKSSLDTISIDVRSAVCILWMAEVTTADKERLRYQARLNAEAMARVAARRQCPAA